MSDVVYMTKESFEQLKEDIFELKTKGRKEIANKIAEARSHGDLSENAEYDAAKHAQELLEIKIHKKETTLGRVQVISPEDLPNDKIYILSRVKMLNKSNNMITECRLVSPEESDYEKMMLSVTSPIGKAMLGKKIGDLFEITAPAGKIQYEILEISK